MRRHLAALLIIFLTVSLASGFSPGDIEWASPAEGTLSRGGTLTNGEYSVKAVEFSSPVPGIKDINGNIVPETEVEPSVFLQISRNGNLLKELVMTIASEPYIDPDYEVKVSATGFTAKNAKEWVYEYYNPSATIAVALRAKPALDVTVTTDKSTYTSYDDSTITATVKVTNSGGARIKNVDVNLNIGELKLRGGDTSQLHRYYYIMEKGTSQSFEVILVVPGLIDQKSYSLSADAKGNDVKDIAYKAAASSVSVPVSPKQNFFTISKAVRDRMYLTDSAIVTVTVANGGMYDAYNIHVSDSMSENFELRSNASFQWDVYVLKPGQEQSTTYSIKPLEANIDGFTIPVATVQFTVNNRQYSASSATTTVVVNGPKIMLNKTVDRADVNIGGDVTVTVTINNVGNIATRAEVNDYLPEGVSLVGGETSIPPLFLEPNTPNSISYTIKMNREGEVQLPAAVANYTGIEYRGTTRSVLSSEKLLITVIDPSKITPTPETPEPPEAATTPEETAPAETPTPTPITPGFDMVLAVIALIFIFYTRR